MEFLKKFLPESFTQIKPSDISVGDLLLWTKKYEVPQGQMGPVELGPDYDLFSFGLAGKGTKFLALSSTNGTTEESMLEFNIDGCVPFRAKSNEDMVSYVNELESKRLSNYVEGLIRSMSKVSNSLKNKVSIGQINLSDEDYAAVFAFAAPVFKTHDEYLLKLDDLILDKPFEEKESTLLEPVKELPSHNFVVSLYNNGNLCSASTLYILGDKLKSEDVYSVLKEKFDSKYHAFPKMNFKVHSVAEERKSFEKFFNRSKPTVYQSLDAVKEKKNFHSVFNN